MLIKKGNYPIAINKNFKGGEGEFKVEQILTQDQLGQAGSLFAWGTLEPGHSVGWHVHHGDTEICCCTAGSGVVIEEDGQPKPFCVGDVNIVPSGCGHEVRNTGDVPLTYVAAVLFPDRGETA